MFLSDYRQVSIAAPRGHGKSTSITFAFVLFIMLHRVSKHLLLIGSNETLGGDFVKEIADEIEDNEALRADYGIVRFLKRTDTQIIVQFRDGEKFRIIAKGAGQRMRGLKWNKKRPDYVLCDDMEDEEMVGNPERTEKFRKWFYGAVKPITKAGGFVRAVGTIIGFGSFLERTMPNVKDTENTVVEPLRVYSKKPRAWMSVLYRAHSDDFSEILWPAQFSEATLRETRADFAEQGMLDMYGQEYLNNPVDPTKAYYRRGDFLPIEEHHRIEHMQRKWTYYVGVDMAISEKERSAYTVFVVGGWDGEFLNIVHVTRERMDSLEIINEFFILDARYKPDMFLVESENISKSIGPVLFKEMEQRNQYLGILDEPPTKDKDKRAKSMQFRMRAGKVRFDKEADWYPDFEEELTRYPKYEYKDQFDAFAWLGFAVDQMADPPSDRELEDEEYENEMRESFGYMGQNATTGY